MKKWIKRAGFGVGVLAALALCAYGLLMVLPFSNTSQLPQPVQQFAQSLPGSQASQEQERIAAADEPTHFVAADGVEYKDSTRQPSFVRLPRWGVCRRSVLLMCPVWGSFLWWLGM